MKTIYSIHGWIVQRMFESRRPRPWAAALWLIRRVTHAHQWLREMRSDATTYRPIDLLVSGLIAGACTAILGWFLICFFGVV